MEKSDKPFLVGFRDHRKTIRHIQFTIDVSQMRFNGIITDAEGFCNLVALEPPHDQFNYFQFTPGQFMDIRPIDDAGVRLDEIAQVDCLQKSPRHGS
jgi:hypothetical protein